MKRLTVKKNGAVFDSVDVENDAVDTVTAGFHASLIDGDPEEYTLEVLDLDNDFDFLLDQCRKKRAEAYPSLGDQADAAFKARAGDSSMQTSIDAAIAAVKAEFPKPTP